MEKKLTRILYHKNIYIFIKNIFLIFALNKFYIANFKSQYTFFKNIKYKLNSKIYITLIYPKYEK